MTTPQDDDATSFEVDRHQENQPPREDLIDPEDIEVGDATDLDDVDLEDVAEVPEVGDPEFLPSSEHLPESQGLDADEADRLTEDAGGRPPLHDEPPLDEA